MESIKENFNKNKDLFQKYYGQQVTIEKVIDGLMGKKNYDEISKIPLFKEEELLGIALGFGRHNAELFQRREELKGTKFSLILPSPRKGFFSTAEELSYLRDHLKPTREMDDCLLRVIGVGFVGDPDHPKTQALAKKYDLLQEKLISIFSKEDWLERVLFQLGQ